MSNRVLVILAIAGAVSFPATGADTKPAKQQHVAKTAISAYPTLGSIERVDKLMDSLVPAGAVIEKLAEGFVWSEGPVWMGTFIAFSDIPTNRVYRWDEKNGLSVFVEPSGYTGTNPRGGERGANGLTRDRQGNLVLCQHGDRRVARLEKDGQFRTITQFYEYRRYNSPNDLVYDNAGNLYFTDPPYGLPANMADPQKELPFQGVFRVAANGNVKLLASNIARPNGIALSPDEKTLFVANSDSARPYVYCFDILPSGEVSNQRVFFDVKTSGKQGGPDGIKVDRHGNLFIAGPGGVLVVSAKGKYLGAIVTGQPTANCAWGDDGSVLYITANHYLLRVKTNTKGKMP